MNKLTTTSTCKTDSVWHRPQPKLDGRSLMDHLFAKLSATYPNSWKSHFTSEMAMNDWRETWAEAFDEDRITGEEIKAGLSNLKRMYVDWAPNLPQFLKACRPKLDPVAALDEAARQMRMRQECKDVWSHPAIFWAAVEVTEHDMLNRTLADVQPRFTRALNALLSNPESINPVPEAAKRLPPPPVMPTEEGDATLKNLLAGLAKFKAKQADGGEGGAA
ncbi:replication protein P [Paraburkholderia sediminicola]|uniref:replication protein P n=1 Tax=Paraburkholderia sediminicola TaxID=458836 RepID=UPI0038BD8EEB